MALWAATDRHLFWTTDSGHHWNDITPSAKASESVDSVFFLDTSAGWALLTAGNENTGEPDFNLASTSDAGANWSITPVKIPRLDPETVTLTGGTHIDFIDLLHGWMPETKCGAIKALRDTFPTDTATEAQLAKHEFLGRN